jgi:hypothetical protein
MRTYTVKGMRVLPGNGDTALVIKGEFAIDGKPLSIKSLSIPKTILKSVKVDLKAGTVTMPEAKRGRPVKPGLDQAAIDALLKGV